MHNPAELRESVRRAYSDAARRPNDAHAFPVGRAFAEDAGYPAALLDDMPSSAVEAFAGVSNVSLFAELEEGMTVLDLGCGGGLDALVAAHRIGPKGRVIGVDFSDDMLDRARAAAKQTACDNITLRRADAETLPLDDASVDAALVNGIFNLNPARPHIFSELARVLRPGGRAWVAELILKAPLPKETRSDPNRWFA